MRSITPVIAIVILVLMAIAAAAMAYLTITTFQNQATEGASGGLETLATKTKTQLRIETVSDGKIYVRNLGTTPLIGANFFVNGKPIQTSGTDECEAGRLCTYTVTEDRTARNPVVMSLAPTPVRARTIQDQAMLKDRCTNGLSEDPPLMFRDPSTRPYPSRTFPSRTGIALGSCEWSASMQMKTSPRAFP